MDTVLAILAHRCFSLTPEQQQRIETASEEQLLNWRLRAIDAERLEDVLDDA